VPRGARSCPDCGADDQTGWNEEETRYDGLDLPEESFDYEEAMRHERSPLPYGMRAFWWIVAVIITVAMAVVLVAR
jgi:hypothetical protein